MSGAVDTVVGVAHEHDCWSVLVWGNAPLAEALRSSDHLAIRERQEGRKVRPDFADLVVVNDASLIEPARKLARKAVLCIAEEVA